jgi:hypothetical protein
VFRVSIYIRFDISSHEMSIVSLKNLSVATLHGRVLALDTAGLDTNELFIVDVMRINISRANKAMTPEQLDMSILTLVSSLSQQSCDAEELGHADIVQDIDKVLGPLASVYRSLERYSRFWKRIAM